MGDEESVGAIIRSALDLVSDGEQRSGVLRNAIEEERTLVVKAEE